MKDEKVERKMREKKESEWEMNETDKIIIVNKKEVLKRWMVNY